MPEFSRDQDLKYSRSQSSRTRGHRALRPIEWITLVHVSVFLVATTWAFGGQSDWVRPYLGALASIGAFITMAAALNSDHWRRGYSRPLLWLIPLAAFNAVVLLAGLNPSLHPIKQGNELAWLAEGARAAWPSSAMPSLAAYNLWLFDATWITCFNIAFIIQQRRAVRWLLWIATLNALALSIFGTIQKLLGAKGIYFGAVPSPQVYFFGPFVYHNHWGAFMLLMLATCLALVWYYRRKEEADDLRHSPAVGGIVIIALIAATLPLSTSRSSSALAGLLLGAALLDWTQRIVARRRRFHESIVPPIAIAVFMVVLTVGGIWSLARETILQRIATTKEQVTAMHTHHSIGSRATLYYDTWEMARAKPWFGWGMSSYPYVFTIYNSQPPIPHFPVFYHDAHSDWLQSLAEHGFIGSALLAAIAIVPLATIRRRNYRHPIIRYLLAGCGLIVAYATVEFPFGNFAVVLGWWVIFFCAVQYARLRDRLAPDSEEAGPHSPPSSTSHA